MYSFGKHFFDVESNGKAFSFSTQSSNDNSAWTSPETFTNGNIPSSGFKRYLRISGTLEADGADTVIINGYTGGILHITKPIYIGTEISKWLTFQMEHIGDLTVAIRIRRSTDTSSNPPNDLTEIGWIVETGTDAEGWRNIPSVGNNSFHSPLGTVLAETGDPLTTWIQIQHQMHANSLSAIDNHSSTPMVVNWLEGSPDFLPITANIYKKKYLLNAAKSNASENDIMIVIDKNNKFMNWTGFSMNLLFLSMTIIVSFSLAFDFAALSKYFFL